MPGRPRALRVARAALAAALGMACAAAAQTGLYPERAGGLGLKAPEPAAGSDPQWVTLSAQWRRWSTPTDTAFYGGERPAPFLGLQARESYAGFFYSPRAGWGTSLEAGYLQDAFPASRRYALGGQVHASFESGQTVSLGLKYLAPESESRRRFGALDPESGGFYGALPLYRGTGWSTGSYQLHMSYQYSPSGTVGIAVGRDLEGRALLTDGALPGLRQFSFMGSHWVTPSWALSYDLLTDDVTSPWKVQGLRLGVRYRW